MYEDGLCSGCGEPLKLSMDYRLEDHYAIAATVRCQGCDTIAEAHKADERDGKRNPQALRHVLGLRAGWEDALAAPAEGAAADQ